MRASPSTYRTAPGEDHPLSSMSLTPGMPGQPRGHEVWQAGHDLRHHGPHRCVCPGIHGVLTALGGTDPVADDSRHLGRSAAGHMGTGGPENSWISTGTAAIVLPTGFGRLPGGHGCVTAQPLLWLG